VPVSISKKPGGYEVRTPTMVHAKKTSFEKAMSQKRLLNAVDHGWKPGRRQGGSSRAVKMDEGR